MLKYKFPFVNKMCSNDCFFLLASVKGNRIFLPLFIAYSLFHSLLSFLTFPSFFISCLLISHQKGGGGILSHFKCK